MKPVANKIKFAALGALLVPCFGRLALHTWTIDTTDLKTALDAIKQAG